MKYFKFLLTCLLVAALLFSLTSNTCASGDNAELPFSINENGETYGDYFRAMRAGEDPDLIFAQGEDGTLGYVRSEDLEEPLPESPEAALAMEAEQRASGYEGRYINLYDADGVTVIGRFFIKAGYLGSSSVSTRSTVSYSDPTEVHTPNHTFYAFSGVQQVWNGVKHLVTINADSSMPAGYLGGKTQLYNADTGALVDSGAYDYSDEAGPAFTVSETYDTSSGVYYAKGIACAFDDGSWGRFGLKKTGNCDID